MFRLRCTLLLLLIACAAFAAPVPKDSWDRPVDPDKDCKFVMKDDTVTIELPGTDHEFAKRKRFNAPRLLRDVEGDFKIQVRVRATFHPSAKSTVDGEKPRVAAGLLLVDTDKNYLRLEYEACRRTNGRPGGVAFKLLGEQIIEAELKPPRKEDYQAKKEHVYLWMQRQGDCLTEAFSFDGKTWIRHYTIEGVLKLPKKVKVGIAAYSTSTEPFKAHFDQLKLTRGRKKSE